MRSLKFPEHCAGSFQPTLTLHISTIMGKRTECIECFYPKCFTVYSTTLIHTYTLCELPFKALTHCLAQKKKMWMKLVLCDTGIFGMDSIPSKYRGSIADTNANTFIV